MDNNLQPTPPNRNAEEIDLGQLFKLIGDGFRKLFNFIGGIFKGLFGFLLQFLLFIQKHFLKFVIAGVLGVILGVVAENFTNTKYVSTMVVEPNFNSVQQLYNNVNFYNELAAVRDSVSLAEALEISVAEAATLREFSIESYADENQKVRLFDQFVRELDTTTQKTINMERFMENFNSLDARFHNISVVATDPFIAQKTRPAILNSISRNDYFKLQKNITQINLDLQDEIIKKQLAEIDSLQELYKRVMEKEAEKPLQGTNISLGENGSQQNKELALINQIDELKASMVSLNQEKANKSSIINVISDFPRRGVELKGLANNLVFLGPVVLMLLTFLVLLVLELNKFLIAYRNKLS
ncbi:hypothetical protein [Robertkochia sediminum]|uniref:hypothetical protein n=1 Tax=Robertkochia sediminum TaxID=2785326 RepID=UPI0019335F1D|nr:hypothetical protein [Robertkochia sediminum]MBL7471749.1 hypothetical protein [Robertkochia sediminum]